MLGHSDALCAYEFRLESRLSVFEEHRNYLAEIGVEFIKGFRLRVSTGKPGHVAYEKPSVLISFNHGGVSLHILIMHNSAN